jgi:hypothetical protein
MQLVPMGVDVGSDEYIDFQTPSLWADYSDRINALFIFMSWVRLFEFFNFFSGRSLGLFFMMFCVFVCGSTLSNVIAFGYYINDYKTIQVAFFTTLNALRGKLPFDHISDMMQSGLAGTVFGLTCVRERASERASASCFSRERISTGVAPPSPPPFICASETFVKQRSASC